MGFINPGGLSVALEGQFAETQAQYMPQCRTIAESIKDQIRAAQANLARLEELEALLKENPNFERMLALLGVRHGL